MKSKLVLGGASGRMITTSDGYPGDGFIADVDTLENAREIVHRYNTQPELLGALKEAHRILELWEITSAAEITGAAIANAESVK